MCDCKPKYKSDWEKEKDVIWFDTMSRNQFFLWLDNKEPGTHYHAPNSRKLKCCGIKKLHYYQYEFKKYFDKYTNHTGSYWWKIEFDSNNEAKYQDLYHLNIRFVQPDEEQIYEDIHRIFKYLEDIRYHKHLLKDAKKHATFREADPLVQRLANRIKDDTLSAKGFVFDLLNDIDENQKLTSIWNQFLEDSKDAQRIVNEMEELAIDELTNLVNHGIEPKGGKSTTLPEVQKATTNKTAEIM